MIFIVFCCFLCVVVVLVYLMGKGWLVFLIFGFLKYWMWIDMLRLLYIWCLVKVYRFFLYFFFLWFGLDSFFIDLKRERERVGM